MNKYFKLSMVVLALMYSMLVYVTANEEEEEPLPTNWKKCEIPTVLKIYNDSTCKDLLTDLTEKYQMDFNTTLR